MHDAVLFALSSSADMDTYLADEDMRETCNYELALMDHEEEPDHPLESLRQNSHHSTIDLNLVSSTPVTPVVPVIVVSDVRSTDCESEV